VARERLAQGLPAYRDVRTEERLTYAAGDRQQYMFSNHSKFFVLSTAPERGVRQPWSLSI